MLEWNHRRAHGPENADEPKQTKLLWYARRGPMAGLRRSAYRKFCRRNRGARLRADLALGFSMQTEIGDSVDNAIYVHGVFEPLTTTLLQRAAATFTTLVDIGCNIGYYTCLWSAVQGKSASIVAIDANPAMVARAQENAHLNDFKGVRFMHCGIASEAGEMTLHVPHHRHSLASFAYDPTAETTRGAEHVSVPVQTLSEVLLQHEVRDAFIKIDTEGFEYEVLSGLDPAHLDRVGAVLFEANYRNLERAGVALSGLLTLPCLGGFELFKVADADGEVAATSVEQLQSLRNININVLAVRPRYLDALDLG